jgi:hypothetical protein
LPRPRRSGGWPELAIPRPPLARPKP